jgi:uncharacterized membrane protein SpoIIM required for sporulation
LVDLDRYISVHQPMWTRLEELSKRARRGARRLDAGELQEMVDLYQRTSSHLAHVRTRYDDAALATRLSSLVGAAQGTIYRRRTHPAVALKDFVVETFPAAVWHARRQVAVAAFLVFAPALALGVWLSVGDHARDALVSPELQRVIAQHEFSNYYRSEAAAEFQTQVTTNNIQVSALAFVSGILLGVPTGLMLLDNGANLGVNAAVMHTHGQGAQFWGLIAPHGLLELTSICIAGGAGLMLAWAIVAPGERTRRAALAQAGQRAVVLVIGLMACFAVAGFIEAWVTPSGLPTWARVGIGAVVEAIFLVYAFGLGHRAAQRGLTGLFAEHPTEPVAEPALTADRST